MFRRSRKKIIVSIMGSLILLFAVTLSVIMLASSREMRRQNTEMLERYVEQYSPDQQGRQEEPEPVPYGQSRVPGVRTRESRPAMKNGTSSFPRSIPSLLRRMERSLPSITVRERSTVKRN